VQASDLKTSQTSRACADHAVDAHHALGLAKVDTAAEGVADEHARVVLDGMVDGVFDIKDDTIRVGRAGLAHLVGVVA